jgi:hypothetical protein
MENTAHTQKADRLKPLTGLTRSICLSTILLFFEIPLATAQRPVVGPDAGIPFNSESVALERFSKPYELPSPKGLVKYQEALVVKLKVDQAEFDSLPPSLDPVLQIGDKQYPIFHIDRKDKRKFLILVFHIRDWATLKDGEEMVLAAPVGDTTMVIGTQSVKTKQTFRKDRIVDNR